MDYNNLMLVPLAIVSKAIWDGAGRQIGQALGNTAESIIMATFGDRATRWRIENLAAESQKCINNLQKRGYTNTKELRELLPKLGLLYVEQASLEDNETLQEVWANLLANALDPQRDFSEFHYAFMDVIRGLSPIEAQLLKYFFQFLQDYLGKATVEAHIGRIVLKWHNVQSAMSISELEYVVAVQNLLRLQIVQYYEKPLEAVGHQGQLKLKQFFHTEEEICFTSFGYLFVKTCLG